jgi:hypothetical protein
MNPLIRLSTGPHFVRKRIAYTLPRLTIIRPKTNFILPFLAIILLASCETETLFKSDFDPTAVNQPPAPAQAVGTVNVGGLSDSVVVIASPVTTGGKWVKISRTADPTTITVMQCNLTKSAGAGLYNFSAIMFIPTGNTGPASLQFEQFGQSIGNLASFLHLDFGNDNMIRLDDNDATKFGHFPRDSAFIVQVTLNINATATPTAHIVLAGAGASGVVDYNILPPFIGMARQFGAVRLWMGLPWVGSFDATTILVTRRNN